MKQLHLFPEVAIDPLALQQVASMGTCSSASPQDTDSTPKSSTSSSANGSFREKVSIDTDPPLAAVQPNYYDIPLPQDATEMEQKVCQYLESHGVRVSSPEGKAKISPHQSPCHVVKVGSPIILNRKKSLLLERRRSLYAKPDSPELPKLGSQISSDNQ